MIPKKAIALFASAPPLFIWPAVSRITLSPRYTTLSLRLSRVYTSKTSTANESSPSSSSFSLIPILAVALTVSIYTRNDLDKLLVLPESIGKDNKTGRKALCENVPSSSSSSPVNSSSNHSTSSSKTDSVTAAARTTNSRLKDGMDPTAGDDYYHDMFPKRQLFRPLLEYPLWNNNWDGLEPNISTGNREVDRKIARKIRNTGTTRHIILIRHGQYDETYKDDTKRTLTPLGIRQAHLTGQRLQQMMTNISDSSIANGFTPCNIIRLHVSDLTRAKETATIIAPYLNVNKATSTTDTNNKKRTAIVQLTEPNPNLNEGRPCHTIPCGNRPVSHKHIEAVDGQHGRIEEAYRTYFYRKQHPLGVPFTTTTIVDDKDRLTDSFTVTSLVEKYFFNNNGSTKDNNRSRDSIIQSMKEENGGDDNDIETHEFEIIVCHANVIRYFLCR